MTSLWFLLGSLALGFWSVTLLRGSWRWWVQAALAVVIGTLLVSWISLLLSLILQSTDYGVTITNYLLVVPVFFVGRIVWRHRARREQIIARLSTLILGLLPFIGLYWLHTPYPNANGGYSSHGYSWGDGPLHMTLASWFAQQAKPLLTLPIFPNTPLSYPFLIDWHAGVLVSLGASWITAMAIPGALLFGAGCILSLELVKRLIGSARAAGIHLTLFLGLGSAYGVVQLVKDYFGGSPIWTTDYSNILQQNLTLANPITSHFLPQRSFLFGFAAVMACLVIIYDFWQKERWKSLVFPSMALGLLPFAHLHAAVIAMGWWSVIMIYTGITKPGSRLWLAIAFVAMLLMASPQIWWLFHSLPAHFGTWKIGWMWNGEGNLFTYWLRQLGLLLLLIPLGLYFLKEKYKNIFLLVGIIGGIILLIAGNLRLFHPSDFDNLKFMLYGFWILLIPVADMLERISRTKYTLVVPLLIALCTIVGVHTVIRDVVSSTSYELFTQEDIAAADDLQSILPLDANVATVERHNNMIAALVGRRVLAGYSGWLWSYGIDYSATLQAQKTIMQGQDDGTLVAKYGVDYIAVHPRDAFGGAANLDALAEKYTQIYSGHSWIVYRTETADPTN